MVWVYCLATAFVLGQGKFVRSDTLFHGFGYGIQRIWDKSPGTLGLGQGIAISRESCLSQTFGYASAAFDAISRPVHEKSLGMDIGVSTRTMENGYKTNRTRNQTPDAEITPSSRKSLVLHD